MAGHVVTAPAVKVRVGAAGGNRVAHILTEGAVVPEGVEQTELDWLVERGFIEPTADHDTDQGDDSGESGDTTDTSSDDTDQGDKPEVDDTPATSATGQVKPKPHGAKNSK